MLKPSDRVKSVKSLKPHMVGKTIKAINESACNCLEIEFTDGTEVRLETESVVSSVGLQGIQGYIRH